jgi:hypothetical protein
MRQMILTPCERVIQDPKSGPSLISTFQNMGIVVPVDPELPSNAVIPKEWTVFAMWLLEAEEQGKSFTLKVAIYWPDGELFTERSVDLIATHPDWMNFIATLNGFPVGQSGKVRISVSAECEGKVVSGPLDTFIAVTVKHDDTVFATAAQNPGVITA